MNDVDTDDEEDIYLDTRLYINTNFLVCMRWIDRSVSNSEYFVIQKFRPLKKGAYVTSIARL
jgi:hypothetical protein